jgi:hypothetical protein
MEALERSPMTSSIMVELQRAFRGGSVGNTALPRLSLRHEECKEVEGLKAERLTWFGGQWCGGEHTRARRSPRWERWCVSPLQARVRRKEVNGGSTSSPWHLEATHDLTGGASVGVQLPWCDHTANVPCARSATEFGSFWIKDGYDRLKPPPSRPSSAQTVHRLQKL